MSFFDFFKKNAKMKNNSRDTCKSKSNMREHLMCEIKKSVESWDKSDIYAVSLFVYDNDDNPYEPTVTLGYNTEENFKSQIGRASDETEARWNYAFWLQNEEYSFGFEDTHSIVKKWIISKGFPYYTYEEVFSDEHSHETFEEITEAFVGELVEIVKELHESGFVKAQFGKDIPILIHELEYYDKIAEQNEAANGGCLPKEFVRFCMGEI